MVPAGSKCKCGDGEMQTGVKDTMKRALLTAVSPTGHAFVNTETIDRLLPQTTCSGDKTSNQPTQVNEKPQPAAWQC